MRHKLSLFFILFLSLLVIAGCKKDEENPVTPPTEDHATGTFTGTLAAGSESGSLTLTIAPTAKPGNDSFSKVSAIYVVTGTFKRLGDTATVTLTGTYDTATDSLIIVGTSIHGVYTFAGKYSGGTLSGTYSGPYGSGSFTLTSTASGTVSVYLGTYTSSVDQSNGRFNLVVKGSAFIGIVFTSGGENVPIHGTISGDNITVYADVVSNLVLATGTFNALHTAATGTYDNHNGDNGTWQCVISQ